MPRRRSADEVDEDFDKLFAMRGFHRRTTSNSTIAINIVEPADSIGCEPPGPGCPKSYGSLVLLDLEQKEIVEKSAAEEQETGGLQLDLHGGHTENSVITNHISRVRTKLMAIARLQAHMLSADMAKAEWRSMGNLDALDNGGAPVCL